MGLTLKFNLEDKRVLVIGGGAVASRRVKKLLSSKALVTVVGPDISREIRELNVAIIEDVYRDEYLTDQILVVAATDSRDINHQVAKDCKEKGILVNIVDDPEMSDITFTSNLGNKYLDISISTGGASPSLSKYIRKDLEERYKKYDEEYMELLKDIRELVLADCREDRREILKKSITLEKDQLKNLYRRLNNDEVSNRN